MLTVAGLIVLFGVCSPVLGLLDTQQPNGNTLAQEVQSLKAQILSLQSVVANLSSIELAVTDLASLQGTTAHNIAQINRTLHHPQNIAFMATLSKTLTSLSRQQHIVFDSVITNQGHAYNVTSGKFTAPVKGTYVFFLTLTNKPNSDTSIKMVKNGLRITHGIAHGDVTPGNTFETTTTVAIVNLHKNDKVWVQNEGAVHSNEGLDGSHYSSFSGHLITPLF